MLRVHFVVLLKVANAQAGLGLALAHRVLGQADVVGRVAHVGLDHLQPAGHLVVAGSTARQHRDVIVVRGQQSFDVVFLDEPLDHRHRPTFGLAREGHRTAGGVNNALGWR